MLICVLDVYFRIDELVLPGLLWTVAMPGSLGTTEKTWVRIILHKLGGALKKSHSLELFTAPGDTK